MMVGITTGKRGKNVLSFGIEMEFPELAVRPYTHIPFNEYFTAQRLQKAPTE